MFHKSAIIYNKEKKRKEVYDTPSTCFNSWKIQQISTYEKAQSRVDDEERSRINFVRIVERSPRPERRAADRLIE